MVVLGVLIASLLIFRALGVAGIAAFASWRVSARDALVVMLLFAASAHFTRMKEDLMQMMPPWVPWRRGMVYFTGFCEIAGAVGLLIPRLRQIAGVCLIAFFLAILPANIHAARTGVRLRDKPATALLLRIPMQLLFIAWTWWCAIER
jgi:uncharacterized membrane protein